MTLFTIETTYRLPVYRQRVYEAATLTEACHRAVQDDGWDDQKSDVESSGQTHVTGVWVGDGAYRGQALPVPSRFRERVERKAEHFGVLLALLREASQAMGRSAVDFARWVPHAQAAVAEADAIVAGGSLRLIPKPA